MINYNHAYINMTAFWHVGSRGGPLFQKTMSILSFFKTTFPIPTADDTGIGLQATQKANEAVKRVMSEQQAKQPAKKRKIYTTFTDQQRPNIGKYAAENGNAACLRKYRSGMTDLGESTVR